MQWMCPFFVSSGTKPLVNHSRESPRHKVKKTEYGELENLEGVDCSKEGNILSLRYTTW